MTFQTATDANFSSSNAKLNSLDDERWLAVQRRDRARDGEFVFAVCSTGIYCRPSCPARRPRPEHVSFFADPDAAERAGFRPCRRCRPRAETTPQETLVSRATAWIDAHPDQPVRLAKLAGDLGVSAGHLQRTFTRLTGVSPRAYAAARRMERAKAQMRAGTGVTRALHGAGFGSSSRFYAQARSALGMTPTAYRQGGAGMAIGYTIGESSVGHILIAATERGICSVRLGDDDAVLVAGLEAEYPRAELRRDDVGLRPTLEAVLEQLQDRHTLLALPLDLVGTPFQHQVWAALREIPAGEQRSYGQVAAQIGRPGAARAVARACAANPAALVVPCHRVVRADGQPGGYRWGRDRKQALLETEGALANEPHA